MSNPVDESPSERKAAKVDRLVSKLELKPKQARVLRAVALMTPGQTYENISPVLDITPGAISNCMTRIRERASNWKRKTNAWDELVRSAPRRKYLLS